MVSEKALIFESKMISFSLKCFCKFCLKFPAICLQEKCWWSSSWTVYEASTSFRIVFMKIRKKENAIIPFWQLRSSNLRRLDVEKVSDSLKNFRVNHPTIVHSCLHWKNRRLLSLKFPTFSFHSQQLAITFYWNNESFWRNSITINEKEKKCTWDLKNVWNQNCRSKY